MINKKITKLMKLIFIITLSISFNSNKTADKSFKESDTYKKIGINECKKELENNVGLKKDFFNPIFLDELLKNDLELCFEFYKKKSEEKITKEDFDTLLKNHKDDIKKVLIENPVVLLEKIIEKKFVKQDNNINLLEIEAELPKMILKNQIPNIENKFQSDIILPKILKIKKEEIKIEEVIIDHYNQQNNKKNPIKKKQQTKIQEVINYIYNEPENKQKEIINNLDLGLFESLKCGDSTKLREYIIKSNSQLTNSSDDADTNSEIIKKVEDEINEIKATINNLSTDSILNKKDIEDLRRQLNEIKTQQEFHKDSKDKNVTQNEIKIIIEKMAELEKKNKQYLYLIITLACPVIFMLYKHIFPSDEN